MHPLDILQGYRLGSRQATVELQRDDVPAIHIAFDVLDLVEDIQQRPGQAVILTGTAGDGKTYLAYRIIDDLKLDRLEVRRAQQDGGYFQEGIFIDLDLSAGSLNPKRVERLHSVLSQPGLLTLVCANEGKLNELEGKMRERGLALPDSVLQINLSRRALVCPEGWRKVLSGVLDSPIWHGYTTEDSLVSRNRTSLTNTAVAERLRRYLLLPYLLGEPITIRELLSFLAYALGGGLGLIEAATIDTSPQSQLPYQLFNTIFSEPDGYVHGGRATPNEKLLWWMFRFDPALQASPEADLRLLVELENLEIAPPPELAALWRNDLVVQRSERSDTPYRRRLNRFMTYARRWYALFSDVGFRAYFPFRYFDDYLHALSLSSEDLQDRVPELIRGLNLLLSGGQKDDRYELKQFYLAAEEVQHGGTIYGSEGIEIDDFRLATSDMLDDSDAHKADHYLERLPRRLYLEHSHHSGIRLPVSLLLYEVLMSAVKPESGFPATLWVKERSAVSRFVSQLSRHQKYASKESFVINLDGARALNLTYHPKYKDLTIS